MAAGAAGAAAAAAMRPRVLIGVTGSVAAVKAPLLALTLARLGCNVRVILTARGDHFWRLTKGYDPKSWEAMAGVPGAVPGGVPVTEALVRGLVAAGSLPDEAGGGRVEAVLRDTDEWDAYHTVKSDPVLHIEVRRRPADARSRPNKRARAASRHRPAGTRRRQAARCDWHPWSHAPVPQLRRWADALVVAPLSANTLGKLAHGMCDDLLVRRRRTTRMW